MNEVELVVAWEWTCPQCEAANFEHAVDVEIPPDDDELKFLADRTDGAGLCMQPRSVKCKGCGVRFPVKSPPPENDWRYGLDDDDDEGDEWKGGAE